MNINVNGGVKPPPPPSSSTKSPPSVKSQLQQGTSQSSTSIPSYLRPVFPSSPTDANTHFKRNWRVGLQYSPEEMERLRKAAMAVKTERESPLVTQESQPKPSSKPLQPLATLNPQLVQTKALKTLQDLEFTDKKPGLLSKSKYQSIHRENQPTIYIKMDDIMKEFGISKEAMKEIGKEEKNWNELIEGLNNLLKDYDPTTQKKFKDFLKTSRSTKVLSAIIDLHGYLKPDENNLSKKNTIISTIVENPSYFESKKMQKTLIDIRNKIRISSLQNIPIVKNKLNVTHVVSKKEQHGYYTVKDSNGKFEVYIELDDKAPTNSANLLKLNSSELLSFERLVRNMPKGTEITEASNLWTKIK